MKWTIITGNMYNLHNVTHVIPNFEERTVSLNFTDGTFMRLEFDKIDLFSFDISMLGLLEDMGFDKEHIKSLMSLYNNKVKNKEKE